MIRDFEKLYAVAGPGGVEGAGSGLGSATSWAIALVVVLFLLALGWGAPPWPSAQSLNPRV